MHSHQETARARHVSMKAVKSHAKSLIRKTGDESLKDAAIRALWGASKRRR